MTGFASSQLVFMFDLSRAAPSRIALALAFLLAAGAASAADKSTKSMGSGPLLTPAQLRDCVAQKEKLHTQTDDAHKDEASIDADKAEIGRSGAALGAEVTTLDRTSASAVDTYNGKVGARDRLIDSYQAKVAAYNAKAETVKATKAAYAKSCENRRYDERDMDDPKAKK
jgi:hypothetical protein